MPPAKILFFLRSKSITKSGRGFAEYIRVLFNSWLQRMPLPTFRQPPL